METKIVHFRCNLRFITERFESIRRFFNHNLYFSFTIITLQLIKILLKVSNKMPLNITTRKQLKQLKIMLQTYMQMVLELHEPIIFLKLIIVSVI